MRTIEGKDFTVTWEETSEMKEAVYKKVIQWIEEHHAFAGEVLCQSDECIIDAPNLLAEIVDDIIKFNWKSK